MRRSKLRFKRGHYRFFGSTLIWIQAALTRGVVWHEIRKWKYKSTQFCICDRRIGYGTTLIGINVSLVIALVMLSLTVCFGIWKSFCIEPLIVISTLPVIISQWADIKIQIASKLFTVSGLTLKNLYDAVVSCSFSPKYKSNRRTRSLPATQMLLVILSNVTSASHFCEAERRPNSSLDGLFRSPLLNFTPSSFIPCCGRLLKLSTGSSGRAKINAYPETEKMGWFLGSILIAICLVCQASFADQPATAISTRMPNIKIHQPNSPKVLCGL